MNVRIVPDIVQELIDLDLLAKVPRIEVDQGFTGPVSDEHVSLILAAKDDFAHPVDVFTLSRRPDEDGVVGQAVGQKRLEPGALVDRRSTTGTL